MHASLHSDWPVPLFLPFPTGGMFALIKQLEKIVDVLRGISVCSMEGKYLMVVRAVEAGIPALLLIQSCCWQSPLTSLRLGVLLC